MKPNCIMKKTKAPGLNETLRLCLFSTTNLSPGTELRYDYGSNELPRRKKTASRGNRTSTNESSTNSKTKDNCILMKKFNKGASALIAHSLEKEALVTETGSLHMHSKEPNKNTNSTTASVDSVLFENDKSTNDTKTSPSVLVILDWKRRYQSKTKQAQRPWALRTWVGAPQSVTPELTHQPSTL